MLSERIYRFVCTAAGRISVIKHNLNDQSWLVDDTNLASPSAVSINNSVTVWKIKSGQIVGQFVCINVGAVCIKSAVDVDELHDRNGEKLREESGAEAPIITNQC